ncbi:hypothetical protein VTK73DRAFT_2729 [Phialemonium thermophilum]|uniref:Cysteine-rich interactor of PDZ three n=1 Tax=Phialemonium thermophilum TaxID=223376 RepID=A0ABR3VPS1_9PEZI
MPTQNHPLPVPGSTHPPSFTVGYSLPPLGVMICPNCPTRSSRPGHWYCGPCTMSGRGLLLEEARSSVPAVPTSFEEAARVARQREAARAMSPVAPPEVPCPSLGGTTIEVPAPQALPGITPLHAPLAPSGAAPANDPGARPRRPLPNARRKRPAGPVPAPAPASLASGVPDILVTSPTREDPECPARRPHQQR